MLTAFKLLKSVKPAGKRFFHDIKTLKSCEGLPTPIAPYSIARTAPADAKIVYLSGFLGQTPDGKLVGPGIEEQTEQVLKNMRTALRAAGSSMDRVLKVRVYLDDFKNFPKMNEIYGKYFKDPHPARLCIAVKELPLKGLVEIECEAVVDPSADIDFS